MNTMEPITTPTIKPTLLYEVDDELEERSTTATEDERTDSPPTVVADEKPALKAVEVLADVPVLEVTEPVKTEEPEVTA